MAEIKMMFNTSRFKGSVPRRPPSPVETVPSAAEIASCRSEPPTKRYVWSHYENTGFPSRVNHATSAYTSPDGKSYMFSLGGYHASPEEQAKAAKSGQPDSSSAKFHTGEIDLHVMDVDTRTWKPVDVIVETDDLSIPIRGGAPSRRYGHACCCYDGKIYMFGGRNDDEGSLGIMECYDIERNMWLLLHCHGNRSSRPTARSGPAMTILGKYLYLHGGVDEGEFRFTNDLFVLDLETLVWKMLPEGGDDMMQRDFHSAIAVEDKIVVFGGRSDLMAPMLSGQDVYEPFFYQYKLAEEKWHQMRITGYHPRGRRSVAAVRIFGHSILYFGGFNAKLSRHYNDLFIYNTLTNHVTEVISFGPTPSPRRRMGHDLIGNEIIICGGTCPETKMVGGRNKMSLKDSSDVYILHLLPSLEELCLVRFVEDRLDSSVLPVSLKEKLVYLQGSH